MILYKKLLNILKIVYLICFIGLLLVGCNNSEIVKNYNFGVLYSNSVFDKTKISLFDSNGKILDTEKTEYNGVTYSAFMDRAQSIGKYVYFANPVSGNSVNDFILQFDKETLESKEIKSSVSSPTAFTVDNTYAYLASSDIENFSVSKVNIKTGKEEYYIEGLSGHIIQMTNVDDVVYALTIEYTDSNNSYGYLNIFKKDDFSEVKKIKIDNIAYSEDIVYRRGNIYILQSLKSESESGNNLIKIDIDTGKVTKIALPFNVLNHIHMNNNFIYVTQGSIRRENTDKKVAKISLDTLEIDVVSTEIENFISFVKNDKFYTSDGNLIQIYDLKNFGKIDEFDISTIDQFATFFIN